MGHDDLQHLPFFLKLYVQLLDCVLIVEYMKTDEIEEHSDGLLEV